MFEIYKSEGKKPKTYIVSDEQHHATVQIAKKYFKVSEAHIECKPGWIVNDDLYLEDPYKKGQKIRWIAYIKRKGD